MKKHTIFVFLIITLLVLSCVPAGAYDAGTVGAYTTVSAGYNHAAAVTGSGELYTWGDNSKGQLGTGDAKNSGTPVKVLDSVVAVSCGNFRTAAIKTDGSLYVWGDGAAYPVKVMVNVAAVSCGADHIAAITTDGSLYVWGGNDYGQVGDGTTEYRQQPVKIMENIVAVSCGNGFTAALSANGALYTWGSSKYGQLGDGGVSNLLAPKLIMYNVISISAGWHHAGAVTADGDVYTWGYNVWGQLGDGTRENTRKPVKVLENAVSISCGGEFTMAVLENGALYSWGYNALGRLGTGDTTGTLEPVSGVSGIAAVSCGYDFAAAVTTDGKLLTWGANSSGQLGYADSESVSPNGANCQTEPKEVAGITVAVTARQRLVAYRNTQEISIDGEKVEFTTYALVDGNGGVTNYIKLRDLAYAIDGTAKRFDVRWENGTINLVTNTAYTSRNGTEMETPFTGNRVYRVSTDTTTIDGGAVTLDAIAISDDSGGGHTYYKLRDLARVLGFNVSWSSADGVYVETDKAYDEGQ